MPTRVPPISVFLVLASLLIAGALQYRLAIRQDTLPRALIDEDARTGTGLSGPERQLVTEICMKSLDLTGADPHRAPGICACVAKRWEQDTARIDRFVLAAARTTPYGRKALEELHYIRLDPSNETQLRRNGDAIAERAMQACRQT